MGNLQLWKDHEQGKQNNKDEEETECGITCEDQEPHTQ